ncbi:sigma-70 family RNA polymerase sigma factor [Lucifera butyrica]|nr:sigma-70 family RNA polymerase sigma factor [Lucifera butyrica]
MMKEQISAICHQFMPLVKKYSWQYRHKLQDAESETWLILIQAAQTYNPKRGVPIAGYLESRVKYGLFNIWRRQRKREQQECFSDDSFFNNLTARENLQEQVEEKEELSKIKEAINQLPPKQRYVIAQTVMNQYKMAKVAQDLGVTTAAVNQLKKRALARLKKKLFAC